MTHEISSPAYSNFVAFSLSLVFLTIEKHGLINLSHSINNSWLSSVFFRSRNYCYHQTHHKSLWISSLVHVKLPLLFWHLTHMIQSLSEHPPFLFISCSQPLSISHTAPQIWVGLSLSAFYVCQQRLTSQGSVLQYLLTILSGLNS